MRDNIHLIEDKHNLIKVLMVKMRRKLKHYNLIGLFLRKWAWKKTVLKVNWMNKQEKALKLSLLKFLSLYMFTSVFKTTLLKPSSKTI